MTTYTAHRIFKGAKQFIVLYADGVEIDRAGGKRAERAQAALVVSYKDAEPRGIWGLRADLAAAQTEARRLVTATTMRTGRYGQVSIPITTAKFAEAVPVTEAAA